MSKECKKCRNSVAEVPRRGRCYCPDPDDNSKCMLFKPMTNGDRIRAMTDEELAWVFHIVAHCEDWGSCERCVFRSLYSCVEEDILEWLQQPVKGDAE